MFKKNTNQTEEILNEKFKTILNDSLNVSNVESISVAESLISKEDHFLKNDVLNLINSPVRRVKLQK